MLRMAVVTDIHYGFDQGNKKGSKAPRLIDKFIEAANKFRADIAVDLGDRVIQKNPEQDRFWLKKLKEHFNKFAMPKYSIMGNHDLTHMTQEENAAILDVPGESHSMDVGGFHVVIWNPNPVARNGELIADDKNITWLKEDLAKTSLPCIVMNHIPLDNHAGEHDHDNGTRHFSFYDNGPDIRKIMEDSGKVKLCLAGHRHRNRHREINGIQYVTMQSLVQECTVKENTVRGPRHRHYARGAFYMIEVTHDAVHIEGYGRGQRSRDLKLAA